MADGAFCVTKAMQHELAQNWGIRTPDEDFSILLEAVLMYDRRVSAALGEDDSTDEEQLWIDIKNGKQFVYPRLLFIVTGKGPDRKKYEDQIKRLKLRRVALRTMWLASEDYPLLLDWFTSCLCARAGTDAESEEFPLPNHKREECYTSSPLEDRAKWPYSEGPHIRRTSNTTRCLNLGSYNYLGFAAADEYCTPRVIESLKKYSASTCSVRVDGGTTKFHNELEELPARFVGKPAAILFGMGYVTNSAIIPCLIGKGGLIISDSLNHNSIVNGARGSGATVRVFQHNSPAHLEEVLREQIAGGQPRTHRPWKRIIVIVEGIYSMEGELCKLPEIIVVSKKYKAYTYLDEAHSIGAVGQSGRGVCELLGVDLADVDIMMGAQKLARIRENSNFFRSELKKMGFEVLGDNDSPVMPIMLYNPAKIPAFSRECLRQKVVVVTVAFPATPLLLARARICISASHTREDLIKALDVISRVGDLVGIKYFPAEPPKIAGADHDKLE
ncbi:UDP-glycosyltransferase TURAN [Zea mays]|uniref:serine C-palmitoyltransferase n=2 Tax=Zea mays TaxID=4577 RepID=A0A1R3LU75_MAIZE|nr:UDP-glycosyltransferase TURAN [Zea mays]